MLKYLLVLLFHRLLRHMSCKACFANGIGQSTVKLLCFHSIAEDLAQIDLAINTTVKLLPKGVKCKYLWKRSYRNDLY